MTKYLVSGYVGFDNFGDEAIVKVLSDELKKSGAEKITWISSNPLKTSRLYDVDSVGMLKFFKALCEADKLISGGGSLLQDITSLKSLIYYLGIIYLALFLGKEVEIYAQGFSEFRTNIGRILTILALKHCHKISVRDDKSKELLKKYGIEAELTEDPVWRTAIPNVQNRHGLGVQLRSFPTVNDNFLEKLTDKIINEYNTKSVKLISLQDSMDLDILKHFGEMLNKKGIKTELISNLSVENAISEISSLENLIAMRFHACLIGVKSGVNVVGINYDKKVETLAQNLHFPLINFE